MDELKTCPICGSKLTIHGPEEWKQTFDDPGRGGDPDNDVCDCGFQIFIGYCEYDEFIKALNRRPAPENKPLTLEQLRQMDGDWVWLIDTRHSEYNGWYNVRPFHDGSGIELYGVDNNYYERAITTDRVKAYARKSEVST